MASAMEVCETFGDNASVFRWHRDDGTVWAAEIERPKIHGGRMIRAYVAVGVHTQKYRSDRLQDAADWLNFLAKRAAEFDATFDANLDAPPLHGAIHAAEPLPDESADR